MAREHLIVWPRLMASILGTSSVSLTKAEWDAMKRIHVLNGIHEDGVAVLKASGSKAVRNAFAALVAKRLVAFDKLTSLGEETLKEVARNEW